MCINVFSLVYFFRSADKNVGAPFDQTEVNFTIMGQYLPP